MLVHLHPQAALSWHAQSGQVRGEQRKYCYLGAHGLQLRFCYDSGIRHVARSEPEQAYSRVGRALSSQSAEHSYRVLQLCAARPCRLR